VNWLSEINSIQIKQKGGDDMKLDILLIISAPIYF